MVLAWTDGWRKHPLLSNNLKFNTVLPGFWYGLGAFGVYLVGSKIYNFSSNRKSNNHSDQYSEHSNTDNGHGHANNHNEKVDH